MRVNARYGWFLLLLVVVLPGAAFGHATDVAVTGRFEERDGQGYLYLWGTPAERGHAEGYLLAPEIHETFTEYLIDGRRITPGVWNMAVVGVVRNRVRVAPHTRERIKGMLRGMADRLSEEELRVGKLGRPLGEEDLLGALAFADFLGFLCSSYVATGEMLEEGDGPFVGRNLDYPGSATLQRNTLVRIEAPGDGTHGWISIGWPGLAGCTTAISDQRISLAVHDVPTDKPNETHLMPRLSALADLIQTLEPGEDLPERAAAQLRENSYAFGMNVMLGWNTSDGGGAVLEVDTNREHDDGVSVRPAEGPFIVCTNHHRLRQNPQRCRRYGDLDDGCALVESMDADLLSFETGWELLDQASVADTLHRCLMDLDSGRVRFQRRAKPRGEFLNPVEFDVDDLFERLDRVREVLEGSPTSQRR